MHWRDFYRDTSPRSAIACDTKRPDLNSRSAMLDFPLAAKLDAARGRSAVPRSDKLGPRVFANGRLQVLRLSSVSQSLSCNLQLIRSRCISLSGGVGEQLTSYSPGGVGTSGAFRIGATCAISPPGPTSCASKLDY
ncbi:hypothetical protein EVAR_32741_1 [Eumeta japonica]|uniref:Uncharacterized protein n=1 Tax=Eumeta variegata TaxID=151549 RepID=A0A4C1XNF1_EUMVA|nr:hypothetical protein EVAR_32741_1 [Eumeta japonica]